MEGCAQMTWKPCLYGSRSSMKIVL
jgi:hypothetical protein